MYVHPQTAPEATALPGIHHATWAGRAEGLSQLSLWHQTIAPGGATPPHRHGCDEIVLCSAGRGELHVGDAVHAFGAGDTVTIPRGVMHQIVSVGAEPLATTAVFAATPVDVQLPDGSALELPWRS